MPVGLPPSPSNLSYSHGGCNGTHVLTMFNWSNQMESGRSLIGSYVLTLTSTESDDEEARSVVNGNTIIYHDSLELPEHVGIYCYSTFQ